MMRRSSGSMSRVINPFFSRAASTVEMRPELAFSELASCDGVMVPRSASSCRMNGSPCAPRANSFCILERLPHTLAYSSLSASRSKPISHRLPIRPLPHYRAPRSTANTFQRHIHRANICNIISHRKQFTVCDYMSALYSPATKLNLYASFPYNHSMATLTKQTVSKQKTSRLDIRLTDAQRQLIERAAELTGSTLTQWTARHLLESARKDIEEATVLHLESQAFQYFIQALDQPVPPAAEKLMERDPQWA